MGLQVAVRKLAQQRAGHLQLLRRGGDGKARGDDVERAAPPVPFFQKRPAVVIGALGRVAQGGGGVAVHHGLAAQHAHAAPLRLLEIGLDGIGVAGAIGHRRGGAVGDQRVIEGAGDARTMGLVRKALFGRERVVVQPVQQLVRPGGDHLRLREMQMRVDEARQDQVRAVVGDGRPLRRLCGHSGEITRSGDQPVLDQEPAILMHRQRPLIARARGTAQKRNGAAAQQLCGGVRQGSDLLCAGR